MEWTSAMARIIIADDEPTHLEMVAAILQRAGHDVVAVSGGKACLRQIEGGGVDLVVTDIFMPDFDGFQLVTALRRNGRRIPVVAMTGGMMGLVQPYAEMMVRSGANAVLIKPFSSSDLLDAVRSSLVLADGSHDAG